MRLFITIPKFSIKFLGEKQMGNKSLLKVERGKQREKKTDR